MKSSRSLLLRRPDLLVTMDDARRELPSASVRIENNVIVAVGAAAETGGPADETIDLAGHILLPGLVNTHHHMFQSLTRAIPAAQDATLFGWLRALYPIWSRLTPEMIRVSTMTAMAELLSGCTTSSDHLYLFPGGISLDDQFEAAETMGMRFHAARGPMSVGESLGGLPPDALVEQEGAILRDTQRQIERWHDPSPRAMRRVVVAPCSPFSVSRDLMRESATLARAMGVHLHTHLAEDASDIAYSRARFGLTPADYAEDVGWIGHDVWHAHCVRLDAAGIARFAATGTGFAHCPCSNMRLGSGIAPVRRMLAAGVPVALGVDGSASNDGAHMIGEARQAMMLARVCHDPADGALMSARSVMDMATRGGARVLGRDDIGQVAPGMTADLVAFDLRALPYAGASGDALAAMVFCAPQPVALSVIDGRIVVRDGRLHSVHLPNLVGQHNGLAYRLLAA